MGQCREWQALHDPYGVTVTGLLHARRESKGVPLIWDIVVVETG